MKMLMTNKGFTLIEIMVAVAITAIAALGLSEAFIVVNKTRTKVTAVSTAIAVEAAFIATISDENTYGGVDLDSGQLPTLNLSLKQDQTYFTITGAQYNTPQYLDDAFNPCAPDFTNKACAVSIRVNKAVFPDHHAYAYQIQANSDLVNMLPLGSTNATFTTNDYNFPVPKKWSAATGGTASCAPGELGLRQVDKVTGTVKCLKRPDVSCAADEVITGMTALPPDAGGNYRSQFTCNNISVKRGCCPENYAFQSFRSAVGVDGNYASEVCVLKFSPANITSTNFLPAGQTWFHGRVCPAGYKNKSTCTMIPGPAANGICHTITAWNPNGCGGYDPDYTDIPVAYKAGSLVITPAPAGDGTLPDGYLKCEITQPQQDCNATWSATLRVDQNCELDTTIYPPTKSAQASCTNNSYAQPSPITVLGVAPVNGGNGDTWASVNANVIASTSPSTCVVTPTAPTIPASCTPSTPTPIPSPTPTPVPSTPTPTPVPPASGYMAFSYTVYFYGAQYATCPATPAQLAAIPAMWRHERMGQGGGQVPPGGTATPFASQADCEAYLGSATLCSEGMLCGSGPGGGIGGPGMPGWGGIDLCTKFQQFCVPYP